MAASCFGIIKKVYLSCVQPVRLVYCVCKPYILHITIMIKLNINPFFVGTHHHQDTAQGNIHYSQFLKKSLTENIKPYTEHILQHGTLTSNTESRYADDKYFYIGKNGMIKLKTDDEYDTKAGELTVDEKHLRHGYIRTEWAMRIKHKISDDIQMDIMKIIKREARDVFTDACLKITGHVYETDNNLTDAYDTKYVTVKNHWTLALFPKHTIMMHIDYYGRNDKDHNFFRVFLYSMTHGDTNRLLFDSIRSSNHFDETTWYKPKAEDSITAALLATHERLGAHSKLGEILQDLSPMIVDEYRTVTQYDFAQIKDMRQTLGYVYARYN